MTKQGIRFDYDLMANAESSARKEFTCVICGEQPSYRWTDYSGQAVCMTCGCCYQLKWGTKEMESEKKYPYIGIKKDFIPIYKQYFKETKSFTFLGSSFSEDTGLKELSEWMDKNYPNYGSE